MGIFKLTHHIKVPKHFLDHLKPAVLGSKGFSLSELLEELLVHWSGCTRRPHPCLTWTTFSLPFFFFTDHSFVYSLPHTLSVASLHLTPERGFARLFAKGSYRRSWSLIQSWGFAEKEALILAFWLCPGPFSVIWAALWEVHSGPARGRRRGCSPFMERETLEAPWDPLSLSARTAPLPESRYLRAIITGDPEATREASAPLLDSCLHMHARKIPPKVIPTLYATNNSNHHQQHLCARQCSCLSPNPERSALPVPRRGRGESGRSWDSAGPDLPSPPHPPISPPSPPAPGAGGVSPPTT